MSTEATREETFAVVPPAGTPPSYVDSTTIDFLKTIHQTFHDQLKTADQKAAYIFTFLVAILIFWSADIKKGFGGLALSDLISLHWFLTFCFAGALCFTIACAALVILPRARPSEVALFWGAWPGAGDKVRNIPEFMASHFVVNAYIENADNLAAICRHKYRYVGFAYRGLSATILFHISILIVG
jgi:hypothetical protein